MNESINKIQNYRYSIVTPARNEEKVINRTVQSVVNQTIKPQKWIILNDGSTDRTGKILDSYSKKHNWMEVIHIEKKVPSYKGVQEKLKIAFDKIDLNKNDFVGKLDADIELNFSYYEDIMRKFCENPKLGISGGRLYNYVNGKKRIESNPADHVRGGLKFYRVQCWRDIGGMEYKLGYDTIDEIKADMFGWQTKSFYDIEALHHRPTEGLSNWNSYGEIAYLVGYHPIFLICRSIKHMITNRPYFIAGIAEMIGFISCYLKKTKRSINDREFINLLRRKQIRRLFKRMA